MIAAKNGSNGVDWSNLPGNESGIQYYESETYHEGGLSFKKGFKDEKIKPGNLVRVYAKPSCPKEQAENSDGWVRSKELAILGFKTYLVDDIGNLKHTLGIDTMYEGKVRSPEEVLGREKIYNILK